jgi:hypothetical protein
MHLAPARVRYFGALLLPVPGLSLGLILAPLDPSHPGSLNFGPLGLAAAKHHDGFC